MIRSSIRPVSGPGMPVIAISDIPKSYTPTALAILQVFIDRKQFAESGSICVNELSSKHEAILVIYLSP